MNKADIDFLEKKLKKYRDVDIDEINIDEVKDISEIKLNRKKNSKERIIDFLKQIENPYVFKVNDKLVKIEFSKNSKIAENCIENVIKSIYE